MISNVAAKLQHCQISFCAISGQFLHHILKNIIKGVVVQCYGVIITISAHWCMSHGKQDLFFVFYSKSAVLIPKCIKYKKMYNGPSFSIPLLMRISVRTQQNTEFPKNCMIALKYEKCPNNYVPLYLGLKTLKKNSKMICIFFSEI